MALRWPTDLEDEDGPYLELLKEIQPRPVFIMGLHRSGTTFLYETLAGWFPLAALTTHDIFTYPRLLSRHQAGTLGASQTELDRFFEGQGLKTREIDEISLHHGMVEEYGWLLQRFGGSVHLEAKTKPLFDEMCRKLRLLRKGTEADLHKNPHDTGYGTRIRELYPEAKFVFIARDPLQTLQSRFKMALLIAGTDASYLHMLLEGFPAAQRAIGTQRLWYRVAGEEWYERIMLRFLQGNIVAGLGKYQASWAALPEAQRIEITYRQLCEVPAETLGRVGEFLGYEPTRPLSKVKPRPRGSSSLHPEVERVRAGFLKRLTRLNLLRSDL